MANEGPFRPYVNTALDPREIATPLATQSLYCALLTASHTPSVSGHTAWSDVSANEVAATGGYTAGGEQVTSLSFNLVGSEWVLDGDDVAWDPSTIIAKYAVLVFRAGASPSVDDVLLAIADLDTTSGSATRASDGGPFTIAFNASGIMKWGEAA